MGTSEVGPSQQGVQVSHACFHCNQQLGSFLEKHVLHDVTMRSGMRLGQALKLHNSAVTIMSQGQK